MKIPGGFLNRNGYTIVELSVVVGLLVLLLAGGSLILSGFVEQNRGLDAGVQLRMIWRAEKLFLIDQLSSPQSLGLPTNLSQLTPYLHTTDLTVQSTLVLDSLPPLDTRDLTSGTAIKSVADPQSGDSRYDVGPE